MSLFSSIQIANNALQAAQVGLQVAGNNVANANTPGYIRQSVTLTPAASQKVGDLQLGLGVKVQGVVQVVDKFLDQRLRGAVSDLANGEAQESTYLQLEGLIGELSTTDLSTSLNNFFGALNDVLNQPESITTRNLAVLSAQALTSDIRRLSGQVTQLRGEANQQILNSADDINRLLDRVAELNVKIVSTEGGDISNSDAVGLRDQRALALTELSGLIGIQAVEQDSGAVSVFLGGEYLVFDGTARTVAASQNLENGDSDYTLVLETTDSPLQITSGKVAGLLTSRDEILVGFQNDLDDFARTLAYEFNKVHSSGQGLVGHQSLVSEFGVNDADEPLDQAGLPFNPVNGSLQVLVKDTQTGISTTSDIVVQLNGFEDDITLSDLAAALDGIDGLAASITSQGKLSLSSEGENFEFGFAGDTSGVLAALGLNTFFTGSSATDLNVNSLVADDPSKLAASKGGIGEDVENLVDLAGFLDRPLESQSGATLADRYDQLVSETIQNAAVSRSVTEGLRVFEQTLSGQQLAVSGVNIDEEIIRMMTFQRSYQATARFISTLSDLLGVLVNL